MLEETASGQARYWVRVAQGRAGNGYGAFTLPRVGMEVLVSFSNGDVDQPLVVGCSYNSQIPQPYGLPEHKTRTLLKSNSSPGGEGYNELRIEDKAGHEQLFVHGQKDFDLSIRNDLRQQTDNDCHGMTGADHYGLLTLTDSSGDQAPTASAPGLTYPALTKLQLALQ